MDLLAFLALVEGTIWIVVPATGASPVWTGIFTLAGVGTAAFFAWRKGIGLKRAGIRLDNLPPAVGLYLGAALLYAGGVLLLCRASLRPLAAAWPNPASAAPLLLWALFQQFCLTSYLLNRLREILGRDLAAAGAAALLFSLLHLPNPFLTLYTLGGGAIIACLFLRWPSLPAAALAHAVASLAVSGLLPPEITGGMRVGPLYLWMR